MPYRIRNSWCLSTSALALIPIVACALALFAGRVTAQTQDPPERQQDVSDKQAPPDTVLKTKTDRRVKPILPPSNPLVKVNPDDGTGNDAKDFNKDGTHKLPNAARATNNGDYRKNPSDIRAVKVAHNLPRFGYDMFASYRRLVRQMQAAQLRRYGNQSDETTRNTRNGGRQSAGNRTGNGRSVNDTRSRSNDNGSTDENPNLPNRDQNDQNSQTGRNTTDEDNGTDSSTTPRRRPTGNEDDQNGDNADSSGNMRGGNDDTGTGSRADDGSDGSDETLSGQDRPTRSDRTDSTADDGTQSSTSDDSTGMVGSTDAELQAEVLRQQNLRRAAYGLAPLPGDQTDSTDQSDSTGYLGSRATTRRRTTTGRNTGNNTGRGDSSGTYSTRDDTESVDRTPTDAFNNIATPLTEMTRNVTATVPATYQVSGGDEVIVHYFNRAMAPVTLTETVDAHGYLQIGKLTRINVAGMTLDMASRAVQSALSHYYRNVQAAVSLKELRTISVTVGGNVMLQGTYTVPAVATVFNVLCAAGGPTLNGSLRNIEVKRGGERIPVDLYQFMAGAAPSGGSHADVTLRSGDIIFVPSYDQLVAVEGAVRNRAIYELKTGEGLETALSFAGGARATATTAEISTLDPGNAHIVKDITLKDHVAMPPQLYDGDVVNVLALQPYQSNKVSVEGAVNQPADYALTNGMTVRDLLAEAHYPLQEAYLGRAALYRWNPNTTSTLIPVNLAKALEGDPKANVTLQKWDRLEVYSQKDSAFVGTGKVEVRGAVQRPGTYEYADNMHVSDLFPKVGGPNPDAEMVVVKHRNGDGTFRYENQPVADFVHGDASHDIAVLDNDVVTIYTNGQTAYIPKHEVRIRGEVNGPGIYDRGEGMKVADLLQISGGFLPDAGSKVTIVHARHLDAGASAGPDRVTVNFDAQHHCAAQDNISLQDGDEVLVQGIGTYEDKPRVVTVKGQVKEPGPIAVAKGERMSDVIKRVGGLLPTAFPAGAQFTRDPRQMASDQQRELARVISDLNDLYNQSAYKRELAKSDLERIKASGAAQDAGSPLGGSAAAAASPAAAALALELSKHDLVTPPRVLKDADLTPNGNLAVDLPAALAHPGGAEDVPVQDGDSIYIPETPTTVQVLGGVVNPRGVKFKAGASLQYYIDAAGGYAPDVAKDHIVVIHPGGGLTPGAKARTLQAGDMIVVPTRVMAEKLSSGGGSFDSLFKSLLSGALVFRLFGL